jgi:peptide-methionine (S)-S-oxide reductase
MDQNPMPETPAAPAMEAPVAAGREVAMFGAGCFWGVEAAFRELDGVKEAAVGYAGGHTRNPTYREVCSDTTGHAEVVRVEFDPAEVSYAQLVQLFFSIHDPTQRNRQGPDIGSQYRSVIFTFSEEQEAVAHRVKRALEASGEFRRPIATEIVPAAPFWRAEEYHQQYLARRGVASCHVRR